MAKNTTKYFTKEMAMDATLLTTSIADIVTGQTDDSIVVSLMVTSTSAAARTVTFYDKDDVICGVATIPANSGTVAGNPPIDILAGFFITRLEFFGEVPVHSLKAAEKIRAKVDDATDDIHVHWIRKDYAA